MTKYSNTIHIICSSARNGKQQRIVGKDAIVARLFSTIRIQSELSNSIIMLCTRSGVILDYIDEESNDNLNGSCIDLRELLVVCNDLTLFDDIPGYVLATSNEDELAEKTKKIMGYLKSLTDILASYSDQNQYLLDCFDAVKNSISIYDKNANLLFANKYFCNYLNIDDRTGVIGMNINDIIDNTGTKIHSIETNTSKLKMFDVLECGEEAIDWEVRIETSNGGAQLVGNDMYPVKDKDGTVEGMVEITHSRQQSLNVAKKYAGFSAEYTFANIIGTSNIMRESIRTAKNYSDSPFSILITGESGVGKELFAQSIHNYSSRSKGPFVALNCASFPENLIESELFGYVGGAFTGAASKGQIGKFELADGGTLFLDEIGELPYHFQSKLLRVLETWTVTRIGSSKQIPVNVRLVTATNRDLPKMVADGLFRQDLYYRLQVLNIDIPPLRDRREDILSISDELLKQAKDPNSLNAKTLSDDAKQILLNYDWPGNVRELRNVLYRATLLSKADIITANTIEASISASISDKRTSTQSRGVLDSSLSNDDRLEKRRQEIDEANANLIREALSISDGNRKNASALLDMSRNTFYRMLDKYNID